MKKTELLSVLGLDDPFKGFTPKEGTKLWGWNGDRPIFPKLVEDIKPKLVIEVGSWMGQSSVNLASSLKRSGLEDSALICIDTWLGSQEHWSDPALRAHMELENGYPTFYKRFMTNVWNAECADKVVTLPMPSQVAASYLRGYKHLKADLIYIDGSHAEKDVYDDLTAYWELLAPGGAIFGDDWTWDSVSNAVKAFCAGVGTQYTVHEINWIIRKRA